VPRADPLPVRVPKGRWVRRSPRQPTFPRPPPPTRRCKTDAIYEEGYDHVLFRYRQREPVDPQAVLDRVHFEETAFVQNRGEEMYDAAALVAASPETVFVHSKAVHFSAAQEAVSRTYTGVFGEYVPRL
jgi:hypothetical protein